VVLVPDSPYKEIYVLDHATVQDNTQMLMEHAMTAQLAVINAQVEIHAINVALTLVYKTDNAHASLTIRLLQEPHLDISTLILTT